MKKYYLSLLCLLTCSFFTWGQNYRQDRGLLLGANVSYQYPTGDMDKILKNGIGANLSAKYLINNVIGIGFESGFHRFKTKIESNTNTNQEYKLSQIPILLEATFYIPTWNRTTLPYLGLHFGGYLTQIKVGQDKLANASETNISKKISIFSPGAGLHGGVLCQLASDYWWLDIRLRANFIPTIENEYTIDEYNTGDIGFDKMLNIGAQIGLLYKF